MVRGVRADGDVDLAVHGDPAAARPAAAPLSRSLLALYDQAFDHRAWHGTTLAGSIRGVSAAAALWRPRAGRHNIWEIVLHAAYWKYIVRRRLTRHPDLVFAREGSNWFAPPAPASERAWRRDVALLKNEHRLLRQAIARFPLDRLGRRAWRSNWTNLATILGIASHDLYHAGQIQLIKRLRRED